MKKLGIWFKVFLLTLILVIPVSLAVLVKERIRKNSQIAQTETYYNSLQAYLLNFKLAQDKYVLDQTQKNLIAMQTAEKAYNDLLNQQPALILNHSTLVQAPQPTVTNSTSSSSSTSSKPTSTRKTKTS